MSKLDFLSCKNFNICEAPFSPLVNYLIKINPSVLDIVDLSFGFILFNFTSLLNIKALLPSKILYEDDHFEKTHQKELK